jgi:NAD-dependent DNA ligase
MKHTKYKHTTVERIEALRRQILIHSCLYYVYDSPIIGDIEYDKRARELTRLQREHPEEAKQGVYAEAFADFSESVTGFNLPIRNEWVVNKALYISRLHNLNRNLR